MIKARHPVVSNLIVRALTHDPVGHLKAASQCRATLRREGFKAPQWHEVIQEQPVPRNDVMEFEPGGHQRGWQSAASAHMEKVFVRLHI